MVVERETAKPLAAEEEAPGIIRENLAVTFIVTSVASEHKPEIGSAGFAEQV